MTKMGKITTMKEKRANEAIFDAGRECMAAGKRLLKLLRESGYEFDVVGHRVQGCGVTGESYEMFVYTDDSERGNRLFDLVVEMQRGD